MLAIRFNSKFVGARAVAVVAAISIAAVGCSKSDTAIPTASISGSSGAGPGNAFPQKPPVNMHPTVKVRTSLGEFTLKLNADLAPLSVDNFLSYVNSGFYNGTVFHQVSDGFIALAGGYDARYQPKTPGTPIRNEAHNKMKNMRGTIAMARQPDAIDSATSQFFINLADNATLDYAGDDPEQYGYCAFGEVTEGMDVIEKIAKCQVANIGQMQNAPAQPIVIESMKSFR